MKKYFFAGLKILLVVFLVICTAYAKSESGTEIVSGLDDRVITVEGTAAGVDSVLLIVYKPDKGPEDIADGESEGVISKIETIPVKKDGSFHLKFAMEDEESGVYTAYLKAGEKIWKETFAYTAKVRLQEALEVLNGITDTTSVTEMQTLYQRYYQDLRLPNTWFVKLDADRQEEVLKKVLQGGTVYESGETIRKVFSETLFTALTNQGIASEELCAALQEYENILLFETDKKLFNVYLTSQNQRTEICKNVLKKRDYENIDSVRSAYIEFALLQAVNDTSAYGDMHQLLDTYYAELGGISFEDYNRLTNNQKKSVDIQMTQTEFEDLAAVKPTFDKYVSQAAANVSGTGSGHTGGGGGSSGGGGARPTVSFEPEEVKNEETPTFSKEIFDDLDEVAWARDSITALYRLGIVEGKSDRIFDPNAQITRSEFVKLLCETMDVKLTGTDVEYSDVDTNDWCWEYIQAASQSGFVKGNPDGSFGKDNPILRQDIAVILYRALDKAGLEWDLDGAEEFDDVEQFDAYSVESALRLRQTGIINGVGGNCFAPKTYASRAEAAKMIYQFYITLQDL